MPSAIGEEHAVGASYVLLSGGFAGALTADRLFGLPLWYLRLRMPLTATVVLCHVAAVGLA